MNMIPTQLQTTRWMGSGGGRDADPNRDSGGGGRSSDPNKVDDEQSDPDDPNSQTVGRPADPKKRPSIVGGGGRDADPKKEKK
jgi:hypothetical protein